MTIPALPSGVPKRTGQMGVDTDTSNDTPYVRTMYVIAYEILATLINGSPLINWVSINATGISSPGTFEKVNGGGSNLTRTVPLDTSWTGQKIKIMNTDSLGGVTTVQVTGGSGNQILANGQLQSSIQLQEYGEYIELGSDGSGTIYQVG
jgi:hypothetical protein